MADEEVRKLLHDLQLANLMENFEKNKITMDVLKLMSEALINDLIPIIGERAIFLNYWRKYFGEGESDKNNDHHVNNKRKRDDDSMTSNSPTNPVKRAPDNQNSPDNSSCVNILFSKISHSNINTKQLVKPLKDLLMESMMGNEILASFRKNNFIYDIHRNKMCHIIVTDLENRSIRLDNALADMIVKMIVDIFPSESAKTYYIAPIAKKDSFNNKSIPARGKLMSTWRNRQCQYKKLQLKVRLEETASDDSTEPETIEDNIKDALEWLETNQAPWNLVLEHWKKTSAHRTKALKQSTDENLVDIFETWKLYKHPSGHELIDVDFQCLNLSKVNLDKDVWFKFFYTLRQHASYSSKDETAKKLIETMKSKDVSDDSMVAMSLSLLPHLYPPRQMKRIKNKNFKPSIGLAKDSLLKFANIPGDMVRLRQETKSRAADLKLPIQPFLIIVGSIEDIQDVYVCVDNELYKVQGVLQGLDICFKTFHVFDLQYPLASQHLWILIQKGLYNINLPSDVHITSIEYVLKQFTQRNTAEEQTSDWNK
ncbi:PREDICTED: uncharacterized protein LOC108766426 [Trachymyrmex cornetzi]|uniref:uncharacterized protein LOC108766426 n=1 Tax=Trachymyrmex cornetzi TaxID=471704 RepID=UPI00084F2654|nr:PREDICTED: uncharacterized protein LOC108766426 [Trachymyrmex cornetzi]